jgi:hypothetical protein
MMSDPALPAPAGVTPRVESSPGATVAPPAGHLARREGIRLGLVVAAITWVWIAVVDAAAGQPFRTFTLLGGIVVFTLAHCVLNMLYGIVLASTVRGLAGTPSLIFAMIFGGLMVEIAFAMVTILLSNIGLGNLAWVGVFGGSMIGTATAIAVLLRTHPLATELRRAEDER